MSEVPLYSKREMGAARARGGWGAASASRVVRAVRAVCARIDLRARGTREVARAARKVRPRIQKQGTLYVFPKS